ncbi:phosphoribosyltransferase family protein [Rhizobium sp. Rhizsp42]|uniref:phosphoribosyltransferase family protein n=1 Tax=Rhizobium sp. Rhizsp42 TaxID=3243034 RepID=UPI0039B0123F
MGINVIKNAVQIDDTHQKRVNTSVDDNPTQVELDGIPVHYVFTRSKYNYDKGDGNPLIYAMKSLNRFTIVPVFRKKVLERCAVIVSKMKIEADVVIPVPSGNGFCLEIAEIVAEVTGLPLAAPDFIRKKTFTEMYAEYGSVPSGLIPAEIDEYKSQLKLWSTASGDKSVVMKMVSPKIRHLFDPFTRSDAPAGLQDKRVVLVDDLLSSGSSLSGAARVCTSVGASSVSGICFMSALAN